MKTVLAIDDDPDILDALELLLTTAGYQAQTTTKGEEICQKVHEHNPDLIILDVLLSGNDGRTICKTLKQHEDTKHIPVIMISAHPSAQESTKNCGADSFVPKPFSMDHLLGEVAKYTS